MSHHILCNHSGPAESCEQCKRLFEQFRYDAQDSEEDIVFKYFPKAVSLLNLANPDPQQAVKDYLNRR